MTIGEVDLTLCEVNLLKSFVFIDACSDVDVCLDRVNQVLKNFDELKNIRDKIQKARDEDLMEEDL